MSGQIHPHVSAVYPLVETPQALQSMLDRTATGKVLIDPHQVTNLRQRSGIVPQL